jgi:RNA polymerase sigma-70 factor, ECF subfamily
MCANFEATNLIRPCAGICAAPATQSNVAEDELIRQLQAGSKMAYREFIEQYQSKVYRLAYGILGDREDADEIAQRVFVKAYLSVKSFDARSSLYTWIYCIAVNECYRFLRKKRVSAPTTDGVVLQRYLLNQLLEQLPDEDRCLLLLTELEGYSATKLSRMTGLSEKTINRKLFRTRRRLAKELSCNVEGTG